MNSGNQQGNASAEVHFAQVVSRGCGLDVHKKVIVATMESTGVYRKPVYNVLEVSGLVCWIVNAAHIKYVLVVAQKITMEDIESVCHGKLGASKKELYEACQGFFDGHHVYMLKLILSEIESTQKTVGELNKKITEALKPYENALELLRKVPGISTKSGEDLIAEIGLDMSVFPTEKHLVSWAGMCPGNSESAGRKKWTHYPGNRQVKSVLTEIAWAATRTKNTFYPARYHKLAARRGKKRALIAVGHSILKSVYHILQNKCEYNEPGAEYPIKRAEAKRKACLRDELKKWGYNVELKQIPPNTAEMASGVETRTAG